MKLRQLTFILGSFFLIVYILWSIMIWFSTPCTGSINDYMMALCELYKAGTVDGKLCSRICDQYVSNVYCDSVNHGYQTYRWADVQIRVQEKHMSLVSQGFSLSSVFAHPAEGSRLEQFRMLVEQHVNSRLGTGDHEKLINHFFTIADVNVDGKVSLSEAKTLWALIQQHEYFLLTSFKSNDKLLLTKEFCGDIYTVEYLPLSTMYTHSYLENLWPSIVLPSWQHRAKIVVGLLEFIMDIYQYQSLGPFYLCSLTDENIGYTKDFDIKMLDVSYILPRNEILAFLWKTPCERDKDCRYTDHCTAVCDTKAKECTDELVRPNLHLVCGLVQPYLLLNVPKHLEQDLNRLLSRCLLLSANSTGFYVEHSIVVNLLKSFLWKQISY